MMPHGEGSAPPPPQVPIPNTGELEQAGHFAFSDACEMLSGFAGDECEEPFIDPDEAHRVIQTWTTAFLQEVQGREDACQYLPGDTEGVRWQEILDD